MKKENKQIEDWEKEKKKREKWEKEIFENKEEIMLKKILISVFVGLGLFFIFTNFIDKPTLAEKSVREFESKKRICESVEIGLMTYDRFKWCQDNYKLKK